MGPDATVMSAMRKPRDVMQPSETLGLHTAAIAFAYGVLDGSLEYGQAVGLLMRAAIRLTRMDEAAIPAIEELRNQVEATLHRTLVEVSAEAVAAIRSDLIVFIARRQPRWLLDEIAYSTNDRHGAPLPRECVISIVLSEVRKSIAATRQGDRP